MTTIYRFARFELSPATRQLLTDNQPTPLGTRAFDVLLALIERRDRLVTKDELLDLVWPGLVVEENNLQVHVSMLRKILGQEAIVTVPGRGYRFALEAVQATGVSPRLDSNTTDNLPSQVTSFVGRERELDELRHLLIRSRLVTLVGVGGIGKTRLSLQVAAEACDSFRGGAWFVELAPLASAELVPQAVASVFGIKETASRSAVDALMKYVKDRELLIILDNCEHLLQACADLVKQLLLSSPNVKVLASSREPMHVAGEKTYLLPTLAFPDSQKNLALADVTQYDAIRLFIERAVAVQPNFQVSEQNLPVLADICRRLDGIPLAIELAATRLRALGLEKLTERLSDRFRLLTGGDQTALPRQQTLRATLDWSFDLLTVPERALFMRLAVFADGWSLEAAETVCAGGELEELDVLEVLTHLVEKSLVVLDPQSGRYRFLETVWEFAQEKLTASGERDEIRTRHLAFYLSLAEDGAPEDRTSGEGARVSRLALERENLMVAHASCDSARGGVKLGLRLTVALARWNYWVHRGLLGLGRKVAIEALARANAEERNLLRCRALLAAGQLVYFMGRHTEAQGYLEEALSIGREIEERAGTIEALRLLGDVSHAIRDPAAAQRHLDEALSLAREAGDKSRLTNVLNSLAELHRGEGNLDLAEALYGEALALARETGNRFGIAVMLLDLAMVSITRGLGDHRRDMVLETLTIIDELDSKWVGRLALNVAFGFAAFRKEWKRAARLCGAVEALGEDIGYFPDPVDERFMAPLVARTRAALGDDEFAAARAAGHRMTYDESMQEVHAWLEDGAD